MFSHICLSPSVVDADSRRIEDYLIEEWVESKPSRRSATDGCHGDTQFQIQAWIIAAENTFTGFDPMTYSDFALLPRWLMFFLCRKRPWPYVSSWWIEWAVLPWIIFAAFLWYSRVPWWYHAHDQTIKNSPQLSITITRRQGSCGIERQNPNKYEGILMAFCNNVSCDEISTLLGHSLHLHRKAGRKTAISKKQNTELKSNGSLFRIAMNANPPRRVDTQTRQSARSLRAVRGLD
jgi:hypothetical protein